MKQCTWGRRQKRRTFGWGFVAHIWSHTHTHICIYIHVYVYWIYTYLFSHTNICIQVDPHDFAVHVCAATHLLGFKFYVFFFLFADLFADLLVPQLFFFVKALKRQNFQNDGQTLVHGHHLGQLCRHGGLHLPGWAASIERQDKSRTNSAGYDSSQGHHCETTFSGGRCHFGAIELHILFGHLMGMELGVTA